jgi:hypothetical protein
MGMSTGLTLGLRGTTEMRSKSAYDNVAASAAPHAPDAKTKIPSAQKTFMPKLPATTARNQRNIRAGR